MATMTRNPPVTKMETVVVVVEPESFTLMLNRSEAARLRMVMARVEWNSTETGLLAYALYKEIRNSGVAINYDEQSTGEKPNFLSFRKVDPE